MFIGLDATRTATTTAKYVKVGSLATEAAKWSANGQVSDLFDFVTTGVVRVTRLADSSCQVLHRGIPHYSIKVSRKQAVHVRHNALIIVNGQAWKMSDFYSSILAL